LLNIQQQVFTDNKISVYLHHHRALKGLNARKPSEVRAAIAGDIEDAAKIISQRLKSSA
jgi:hypothetical protein